MHLGKHNEIFIRKNAKKIQFIKLTLLFSILLVNHLITSIENCTNFKKETKIRIRKNGYTNLIIGIEEGVEENVELLERIKETFTQASELLFKITKKRVFFREIIIVIPSSWNLEHYYDDFNFNFYNGRLSNTTWESYDNADICIENRDSFTIDIPIVANHANKCGETASHISLTPEYFLNENKAIRLFGPYSNVLMHYWAQFRYGVFPEYSHKTLENNQEFYLNEKGEIEATRCSLSISGQVKNPLNFNGKCDSFLPNGLPSNDCIFEEDQLNITDPNAKMGSLLYKPFLNQLNEFCDNSTDSSQAMHNKLAPTIQNKECNGQSVWEVMRSHEDFTDFKNMPNNQIKSTVPKFQILKKRVKKIVLLIDKSIEIKLKKKFYKLEKALKDYVKMMLSENNLIGIVHFENFAKIALPMTLVKGHTNRKKILDSVIPSNPNTKKPNVWNAISLSLSLLKSTLNSANNVTGGNIILITGSNIDPNYPNRNTILDQIIRNEITFDSIRIDNDYDYVLDYIAHKTDGLHFLITDSHPFPSIDDSLAFISNRETKNSKKIIELLNTYFESNSNPLVGQIHIDESISARRDSILKFSFDIGNLNEYIEINVYEPNNKKHESNYNLKCRDSSLFLSEKSLEPKSQDISCEFKKPKVGIWTYEVVNSNNQNLTMNLRAYVFFHDLVDETSYYQNYYDREDYDPDAKLKRQIKTNFLSGIKVEAKWSKSVIIYPELQAIHVLLSKGFKPILNASVRAIIYRPSGDVVTLELNDDGLNADRYKDDGIYSKYFTNYNLNGSYYGRIEIKSNQDTKINMQKIVGTPDYEHYPTIGIVNKLDTDYLLIPTDKLQRTVNLVSFLLRNFTTNFDFIKPSKIKDLEVVDFDSDKKEVKFSFTAPGDDGDVGRASKYDIKCSYDPKYLSNNNFETNEYNLNSLAISIVFSSFEYIPNQAGYIEQFILNVTNYHRETFSIKIRAIDSYDNRAEWSKVLTVKLTKFIKYSPQLRESNDTVNQIKYAAETLRLIEAKENFYRNIFIGVLVFLGIIISIQIIILILLSIQKLKGTKEQTDDEESIDNLIKSMPIRV